MNYTHILKLSVVVGFLSACSVSVEKKQINGEDMLVCHVEKVEKEEYTLNLSEWVTSFDVIPLETHDSCLIKDIGKIVLSENYIGIVDRDVYDHPVKLFDRQGQFITNVGQRGQGPEEYLDLSDAYLDEDRNCFYLIGFAGVDKILGYNLKGEFTKSIPLAFKSIDKPKFFIDGDTITCFSMPLANKSVIVFRQTLDGSVIDSVPATPNMYATNYDGEIFVTANASKYELFYTGVDTLFHYNRIHNKLNPAFTATFPHPTIHTYSELPACFVIWSMDIKNPYKQQLMVIDKKTQEARYVQLKNDLFGNIPVNFYRYDKGNIIFIYNSFELKEYIQKALENPGLEKELKERFIKLDQQLTGEENPILMIGKLKNEKGRVNQ